MPHLPCARPHRRIAGANGFDHPFHGPRWPVSCLGIPPPVLLHGMPRPAECDQSARQQRLRRHRYHAEPQNARWTTMSAPDPEAQQLSFWRRAWSFLVEPWGVLISPSSVFGLGVLVLAGFVAGLIFLGGACTPPAVSSTGKWSALL